MNYRVILEKKNPRNIYEFALGKFAWVCVSDSIREDDCLIPGFSRIPLE